MAPGPSMLDSAKGSSRHKIMTPMTPTSLSSSRDRTRGVPRLESDDSFGGGFNDMAWAGDMLDSPSDASDNDLADTLTSMASTKRATGAGDAFIKPPTRQVSAASAEWFSVSQDSSPFPQSNGSSEQHAHSHHRHGKQKSDTSAFLSPPTPTRSSRNKSHDMSSKDDDNTDKKSSARRTQRRSTSDGHLMDDADETDRHRNKHTSAAAALPTPEEIKRAEEILRLAAKKKQKETEGDVKKSTHRSSRNHRSDDDEVYRRKSNVNDDDDEQAQQSAKRKGGRRTHAADNHNNNKTDAVDWGDMSESETVSSSRGSSRRSSKPADDEEDEIPKNSSRRSNHASSSRRNSDESSDRKEFSKPKREKSLEDMFMERADPSESDLEDGSVVSKTRQTARRGRPTRRQSTAGGPADRSLSRSTHGSVSDRSVSRTRRASIAVGGVEEMRARSLSRTRRRGSMNNAQATTTKTPERSMLGGDQSDSEQNEDDALDFEAVKRREILNQSRKGPIVSDSLRHAASSHHVAAPEPQNGDTNNHVAGATGYYEESGEFSQSSANNSPTHRSRKPLNVSSNDWEKGLDDVLNRRHAARDGSSIFVPSADNISPKSQRQGMVAEAGKYGDGRRSSNSGVAATGPKIDVSKMTVPIASQQPQKKKGWGTRLQQIGAKGKERKNVV